MYTYSTERINQDDMKFFGKSLPDRLNANAAIGLEVVSVFLAGDDLVIVSRKEDPPAGSEKKPE